MNTIPQHHRWPAEGSAQQHWQEIVIEDQIFGGSWGRGVFSLVAISMLVSRKMCVCCKCMQVSAKVGAVV